MYIFLEGVVKELYIRDALTLEPPNVLADYYK